MINLTDIISSIPNTITLIVDKFDVLIEIFGEASILKKIEKKSTLQDIFGEVNAFRIKALTDEISETIIINLFERDYEVYYSPQKEMEYIVYYFLDYSYCSNITSRLDKSLYDLESKKEELQAVFDLAANGISILDRNGMFLYANHFFQKMMGYTMEELIHESCISLSSLEYAMASKNAVKRSIEEGNVINFRKVCVTKSGEHLNASMSLSYLKHRDEILMITADITEDVLYQNQLKQQVEIEVAKRTEQYEIMCHQSRLAAMGEMIDSIAHQWRQPLNGLGLIVQGLRHISNETGNIDLKLLREIECEIMNKIQYMSQTIEDFSTFFRISKEKRKFNIIEGIEEALRLIQLQLTKENIKVNIYVQEDLNLFIYGLANEFRQVIINLVHNAMMAIVNNGNEKGRIVINIDNFDNMIRISISDNGGGIKEEIIQKIFDPYFTTRENGSGIGLYMSKIIIENYMDGILNVINHNKGAQFYIVLPELKDIINGSNL